MKKRIISLVLAASLVIGGFGTVFAASSSDIDGTVYEDAVTRLAALNILGGYEDGTFKPEKTITRAEFAKIVANMTGVGAAADYAKAQIKFSDVPASHWAAGFINVVSDTKVITGYGDGNFGPQDQVTYEQAITMIVRALGYEEKAKVNGGYPGGYLAIAAEKDITEDVNIVRGLAATRGDVALMVNEALTVKMMKQSAFGPNPEWTESSDTLMTTKLGVKELASDDDVRVVITDTAKTDSGLDDDQVKINGKKYTMETDFNAESLLGLEVTAWVKSSKVFFYSVETDEDNLAFDTVSKEDNKDELNLYVKDDKYDWNKNVKIYINNEIAKKDDVNKDMYGYVVFNDRDEVLYVNLYDFNEVANGVVYKVDGDVYEYVDGAGKDEIDLGDYKDGVFAYDEKFNAIDVDAVDVNSAIYAWETSDELYLVTKNETKEGNLDRIKDKEIKVDGDSIDTGIWGASFSDDNLDTFGPYVQISNIDGLGDENVVAVLDLNNELQLLYGKSNATSSWMYGIVTYTNVGSKATATVFGADEEEVDYHFETRSDGATLKDLDYFAKANVALGTKFAAMKFKLNSDGEIAANATGVTNNDQAIIEYANGTATVTGGTKKTLTKVDEKNYVTYGGGKYYITKDTIFVKPINSKSSLSPSTISYDNIYNSAFTTEEALIFGTPNKGADMIVFLNTNFSVTDDDYFFGVVQEKPWKDGDDYVAEIDVQGKGKKEYKLASTTNINNASVVKFYLDNNDEAVFVTVKTPTNLAVNNYTYDDGYISDGANTYNVGDGVVIYSLKTTDKVDNELNETKLDKYNEIALITDDGVVVAAIVKDKKDAAHTVRTTTAKITGNALLAATTDGVTVDMSLATADSLSDFRLMIFEGTNVTGHAITADPQVFDVAALNLSDNKAYKIEVQKLADGTVIATKNVTTLTPTADAAAAADTNLTTAKNLVKGSNTTYTTTSWNAYNLAVNTTAMGMPESTTAEKVAKTTAINTAIANNVLVTQVLTNVTVALNTETIASVSGGTSQAVITYEDQEGNAMIIVPATTWNTVMNGVTVDVNGLVTVATGATTTTGDITATVAGSTYSAILTVN